MSGGAIHLGIGDGQTVARIRPEAFAFAEKHKGQGMSSVMTRNEPFRPRTAPAGRKKSEIGPIPGFDQDKVATLLATVPRVKPEAAENAKKATGSMANILAQAPPKERFLKFIFDSNRYHAKSYSLNLHAFKIRNFKFNKTKFAYSY